MMTKSLNARLYSKLCFFAHEYKDVGAPTTDLVPNILVQVYTLFQYHTLDFGVHFCRYNKGYVIIH